MRQVGLQEYLNDFWNIVDCSQFVVFGYLTYVKIFEHSKSDSGEE